MDSASKVNELEYMSTISDISPDTTKALTQQVPNFEIWVGYERHGRHYIDKFGLPGTTETKFQAFRAWRKGAVPRWERVTRRAVFCQRPVIAIGTLPRV